MKHVFWLVIIALNFNCEEITEVPDISGETVTTLAPADHSVLNNTTVNFSWNAVEEASRYQLQIASPEFQNAIAIVEDTIVTANSFSKALNAGEYQWRVQALNSDYRTAYTTQSFSITESDAEDISDEEVVLLAPANAIVFTTIDTINFSWETVLNADTYTVQIATPDFENALEIIENEIVNSTNFSVTNLEAQEYEWRVKAQNFSYETNYTTQSFTVEE